MGRSDGPGTGGGRFNQDTETFETWPATARGFGSGPGDEQVNGFQVGVAFLNLGRAAGVGQPFAGSIFDFPE